MINRVNVIRPMRRLAIIVFGSLALSSLTAENAAANYTYDFSFSGPDNAGSPS